MVMAVFQSNIVYKKDYNLMTSNLIIIFKLFWTWNPSARKVDMEG